MKKFYIYASNMIELHGNEDYVLDGQVYVLVTKCVEELKEPLNLQYFKTSFKQEVQRIRKGM